MTSSAALPIIESGGNRLQQLRKPQLDDQRKRLRAEDFRPRPLTSFVCNRLISQGPDRRDDRTAGAGRE